jgi:hypothetical protein
MPVRTTVASVAAAVTKFVHNTTKTMHFEPVGKGYMRNGYTAAFTEVDNETILVGVATCGGNDVFNKKTGRQIAEGRMKKIPYTVKKEPNELAHQVVREFVNDMYYENDGEL